MQHKNYQIKIGILLCVEWALGYGVNSVNNAPALKNRQNISILSLNKETPNDHSHHWGKKFILIAIDSVFYFGWVVLFERGVMIDKPHFNERQSI